MLILTEADIEQVLTMEQCLTVLEHTFADFGRGQAVNRPRTHTYTPMGRGRFYNFKSMDGAVPRLGVHGLRITSELLQETEAFGMRRQLKLPAVEGERYVGLVMLFDLATTAPLAILQDAGLQRLRVGATSGLAAKYLSRQESHRVGLFGTGWQAGPQLEALVQVRSIDSVVVYSPNHAHCRQFAADMSEKLKVSVVPVETPQMVVSGADIVVCATSSLQPILVGDWLEPGQHVNSLQAGELDARTLQRADRIAVRAREQALHYLPADSDELPPPMRTQDPQYARPVDPAKVVELGKVVAGIARGRTAPEQITLFGGGGTGPSSGLGIQFAAVAKVAVDSAVELGLGHYIPTEWFTQTHHS